MQNFDESSARRRPMYVPDYARIRFCGSKLIPGRSRIATVSHHGSRGPPPVAGHGIFKRPIAVFALPDRNLGRRRMRTGLILLAVACAMFTLSSPVSCRRCHRLYLHEARCLGAYRNWTRGRRRLLGRQRRRTVWG
jgi:hypothetical protein